MAENKKSFMDELSKLAEITNIIEQSFLSNGDVSMIIELPEKDYKDLMSHFRELDRDKDKCTIEIDGVNFNFVLKK